ncbi:MAG: precorrin-6y C5,15-methyltransferase (decarboxylating) subunit CbiE [Deltaproteobacteria bacterium]|nr:precorrin-6y C5,15-methyltransferase (decarboxylating) subunit CbiE [Deltaproteobacteria bacterium]
MITIIGLGINNRESLGKAQLDIIESATLLVGGARHLSEFSDVKADKLQIKGSLDDIGQKIQVHLSKNKGVTILATGDPSIYGIADFIIKRFGKPRVRIIPNVSAAQEAFARIKENANGVRILSVHGGRADVDELLRSIRGDEKLAIFTDHVNTPGRIAAALIAEGHVNYSAYVCEAIGAEHERIIKGNLEKIASINEFNALNVMILIPAPRAAKTDGKRFKTMGLPDALFSRDANLMTKEEVRVIALSKMDIKEGSVIWDIGSGSGSIAIEAARSAPFGRVWAIEKNGARTLDIKKNMKMFGVKNIEIINASAPDCLLSDGLPAPQCVFVGGGGKDVERILAVIADRIELHGRVVVNAAALETAHTASTFFKRKAWPLEVVHVNISKAKEIGDLSVLSSANPVFVITGIKPERLT